MIELTSLISSADETLCLASYHSWTVEEIRSSESVFLSELSQGRYLKEFPQWETDDLDLDFDIVLAIGLFRKEPADRQVFSADSLLKGH